MRIKCPYCGERDASEFAYLGAADLKRPDPAGEGAAQAFYDYVYLRENRRASWRSFGITPPAATLG